MGKDKHNSRRSLSADELKLIIERLENADPSITISYEYPVDDLLANLKENADAANEFVEIDSEGNHIQYLLNFCSPAWTWEELCGAAGIFTIDAASLKSLGFEISVMN